MALGSASTPSCNPETSFPDEESKHFFEWILPTTHSTSSKFAPSFLTSQLPADCQDPTPETPTLGGCIPWSGSSCLWLKIEISEAFLLFVAGEHVTGMDILVLEQEQVFFCAPSSSLTSPTRSCGSHHLKFQTHPPSNQHSGGCAPISTYPGERCRPHLGAPTHDFILKEEEEYDSMNQESME